MLAASARFVGFFDARCLSGRLSGKERLGMPFLPNRMWQQMVPMGAEQRIANTSAGTANDFAQCVTSVPNPKLFSNGIALNAVRGGLKGERMQPSAAYFMSDSANVNGVATNTCDLRLVVYRGGVYQGAIAYYSLSVATTLGTAITSGNVNSFVAVTPASMAGIVAGQWLVIDAGAATQEYVMVASVTATTFTALFTQLHTTAATVKSVLAQYVATPFVLADTLPASGTTAGNAVSGAGSAIVLLSNPYGVHVGDALTVDSAGTPETVTVSACAVVNTTSGSSTVAGAGSATITPGSMSGILVGTPLVVDGDGAKGTKETVIVTAVTATTFTATFAGAHTAGFLIRSDNFTASFTAAHTNGFTIATAASASAMANGAPFELQESDVLVVQRVSSSLAGLATPAGSLQVEWRPSERKM